MFNKSNNHKGITALLALGASGLAIALTMTASVEARPLVLAGFRGQNGAVGAAQGTNGSIYRSGVRGDYGAGVCAGGMHTGGTGRGGCQSTYNNGEGTTYNGKTRWNYDSQTGTSDRTVNRTGTGNNNNSFTTDKNSSLDTQTGTGTRTVNHTGTTSEGNSFDKTKSTTTDLRNQTRTSTTENTGTYNGNSYDTTKTKTYANGEFCRTVSGTVGQKTYTNSGQFSCQ